MSNIQVQNGQLPQGFCPPDYQTLLNAFSAAQFVSIATISGIVVSSTPPVDHSVAWLQLDSLGRPTRFYFFAQGAWLSLHPLPPGFTMLWLPALPNFQTFDGGDATAAPWSALSGQMWQLASNTLDGKGTIADIMSGRAPVGVGTFPSGASIAAQQQLGEDLHKITSQESFPHGHFERVAVNRAVPNGGQVDTSGNGGFVGPISLGGVEEFGAIVGGDPNTGNPPTSALAHNTLQPSTGVYFLQRTNRLFYLVNP